MTPTTHKSHTLNNGRSCGKSIEVEIANVYVETLDEATRAKLVNSPKPKVAYARTGEISTCMDQMVILDYMDPRRLKLKQESEAHCCVHSCKHYSNIPKMHWKVSSSDKKGNNSGSYHTTHEMIHLKRTCTEEWHNSMKDSLKATELKEKKYKEEETEIVEKNYIEKGAEAIIKERKIGRATHVQQNYYHHCLIKMNILV